MRRGDEMSWKLLVKSNETEKWYSNGLRYATKKEVEARLSKLKELWNIPWETRVAQSDEPVNAKHENGTITILEL